MDTKDGPSIAHIIIRFFTGFGAGLSGSIVFLLILFAGWSVVGETLSVTPETMNEFGVLVGQNSTHPLFVYLVLLATFLGVLASTAAYTFLMTLIESRFTLRSTTLTHVFFGNLVLMIFLLPAYVVASSEIGLDGITSVVLAHILISGLFSFLVIESLHSNKYFLVKVYALIIALSFFFFMSTKLATNTTSLVILSMPFLFGFLAMTSSLAMAIYKWFYRTYGSDVLNIDTRFGSDYDDNSKNY